MHDANLERDFKPIKRCGFIANCLHDGTGNNIHSLSENATVDKFRINNTTVSRKKTSKQMKK